MHILAYKLLAMGKMILAPLDFFPIFPKITFFAYEELLAFKRACKTLGLTKEDVEDIMYNNANNLINLLFIDFLPLPNSCFLFYHTNPVKTRTGTTA